MEIKSMIEFNPSYHKDGTLIWKKIGEKTGRRGRRKQKHFNRIDISRIVVPEEKKIIDEKVLEESRHQYEETHMMIPVFLSYDFELIAGYEQYVLARELGIKSIAFDRVTKLNKKEQKAFRKKVHNNAIGNKKYPVIDIDGGKIYVTYRQKKLLDTCFKLARKFNKSLEITSKLRINIIDAGVKIKENIKITTALNYLKNMQPK